MAKLLNMVQQLVTAVASSGTGALTLGTAQAGYDSMAGAGAVDGGVYSYVIQEGVKWEIGRGTYTASGTSFARTTITKSSAGAATAETFTTACILVITPLLVDFTPAVASDVWAGTDNDKLLSSKSLADAAAFQTLTDAATVAWDTSTQGFNAKVTLGGNRTIGAPTNLKDGVTYTLNLIQDATGSRVPSWNTIWDFGAAGAPTLQTAAGKIDKVVAQYNSATSKLEASFRKGA